MIINFNIDLLTQINFYTDLLKLIYFNCCFSSKIFYNFKIMITSKQNLL